MLSPDALAIAYAYLLSFIIIGIIVGLAASVSRLIEKRARATSGAGEGVPAVAAPPPQRPVTTESPEALLREVAAAAVAAYLAAQPAAPARVTSAPPQSVVTGWVYRWRAQVSTSPNELSVLKALRRR